MMQRVFLTATLAAAVLATAAPAFAQLRQPTSINAPNRPYRGLFGNGQNLGGDRLIVRGWLAGGYDDVIRRELAAGSALPAVRRNGPFGSGAVSMGYSINRSAVTFNVQGGAAARAYTGMSGPPIVTWAVTAQSGFNITATTNVSLNVQTGSYLQNFAAFGPLAGGGGNPLSSAADQMTDPTALAGGQTYQTSRLDMMFSQRVATKVSLNFGYQYYTNNAWSGAPVGAYDGQALSAGVSYAIGLGLSARVGYSAIGSGFRSGSATQFRGRGIDAGVDFNKSLSVTRKSALGFGTGATGYADSTNTIRYVWTGHINYSYELGRSWTLGAGYNRSADFFTTFGQPVLLDWAQVNVNGMMGRRYQLGGDIGLTRGNVLITSNNSGYRAALGGGSFRTAISRELAVSVSYTYYHYFVDNGVPLPPGMLSRLEQQSVRVSLDVWAPLMSRARRTNASR